VSSPSTSSSSSSPSSPPSFARVEREALFSEEIAPGIGIRSEHDGGGGGVGVGVGVVFGIEELRALVMSAESALPPGVHPSDVPIYLGATAGMRMIQHVEDGEYVLAEVRSVLRDSGFHFPRDDMARILSGEEEGAYDWLVANYLLNDGEMPTMGEVRGAMDLGGASVQVSYLASSSSSSTSKMLRSLSKMMRSSSSSSSSSSSNDVEQHQRGYPLRIRDVEYPVFTRSLLHYGVDRGRMRYDSEVVVASSFHGGNNSKNPCYPIGYDDPASNMTGSSDWERCLHSVGGLFDDEDSSRNSDEQLPIDHDRKFIAMSALVYIWDYLGLKIGNETDDLIALSANARRLCSLNRTGQVEMYERHMEENAIIDRRTNKPHAQCFNAAFTYHLLSRGFGLPLADTPIEIYYDIGGTKVQWALGLMLVEANKVGVDFKGRAHNMSIAIVDDVSTHGGRLLKYFTFTILLALMLVLWRFRRRRFSDGLPVVDPSATIPCFSPRKEK